MKNSSLPYLLSFFLAKIKKKYGITAKLLSYELGISKNTLTNWKNGVFHPNIDSIGKLLSYLQMFKRENKELINNDESLSNVCNKLILILEFEFYSMPEKPTAISKQRGKKLLEERKENFLQSFNNYLLFLKEMSGKFDTDYDNSENYDYNNKQKNIEIFDILINEQLINSSKKTGIQKLLAKRLGVSCAQISNWKTGKCYPSKTNLTKIRNVLRIDPVLRVHTNSDFTFFYQDSLDKLSFIDEFIRDFIEFLKQTIEKSPVLSQNFYEEINHWNFEFPTNEDRYKETKELLYKDVLTLLRTSFNALYKTDNGFPEWLYKQTNDKTIKYMYYSNFNIKLDSVEDIRYFSKTIYDSFKYLRDYLDGKLSEIDFKELVLGYYDHFVLARDLILSFNNEESFVIWFDKNTSNYEINAYYSVNSININDLFLTNKEDLLKEFFFQFKKTYYRYRTKEMSLKYMFFLIDVIDFDTNKKSSTIIQQLEENWDFFLDIFEGRDINKKKIQVESLAESISIDKQKIEKFAIEYPGLYYLITGKY